MSQNAASDPSSSCFDHQKFYHGIPMAPGSAVWPASYAHARPNLFCKKASSAANMKHHLDSSTNMEAVDSLVIQAEYTTLLERRTKLRQTGRVEAANTVQAAVNVGVLLNWSMQDVLKVVRRLEDPDEDFTASKGKVSGKVGDVLVEKKMLDMWHERRLAQKLNSEDDLAQLLELRQIHTPRTPALEGNIASPLLLIKIQAALNIAFQHVWNSTTQNSTNDPNSQIPTNIRHDSPPLDPTLLGHKATHLLRVPNKHTGEEILYLLRNSAIGRQRYPVATNGGRTIKTCPGIERALSDSEKKRILQDLLQDVPQGQGQALVRALLDVFGRRSSGSRIVPGGGEQLVETQTQTAWIGGNVKRMAVAELPDEAFLVLEYMYRKMVGWPLLSGDVAGLDDEGEETENESEEICW